MYLTLKYKAPISCRQGAGHFSIDVVTSKGHIRRQFRRVIFPFEICSDIMKYKALISSRVIFPLM